MVNIMQGDEYGIPFQVITPDGIVTPDLVENVEITIDDVSKSMKNGEITFDDKTKDFIFPLKQIDSFSFFVGTHTAQVRVKFLTGDVVGISLGTFDVKKSRSKEVL